MSAGLHSPVASYEALSPQFSPAISIDDLVPLDTYAVFPPDELTTITRPDVSLQSLEGDSFIRALIAQCVYAEVSSSHRATDDPDMLVSLNDAQRAVFDEAKVHAAHMANIAALEAMALDTLTAEHDSLFYIPPGSLNPKMFDTERPASPTDIVQYGRRAVRATTTLYMPSTFNEQTGTTTMDQVTSDITFVRSRHLPKSERQVSKTYGGKLLVPGWHLGRITLSRESLKTSQDDTIVLAERNEMSAHYVPTSRQGENVLLLAQSSSGVMGDQEDHELEAHSIPYYIPTRLTPRSRHQRRIRESRHLLRKQHAVVPEGFVSGAILDMALADFAA